MTTQQVVADDVLATYLRREWDLRRRFLEGTLDPQNVLAQMQDIIEGRVQPSPAQIQPATTAMLKSLDQRLCEQTEMFKKYLGLKLDFSGLKIPERPEGFNRLIVVPRELAEPWKLGNGKAKMQPLNWLYAVCEKHFKCWRYSTDLDAAIPTHDRHPKNGTYAIWTRGRIEADEENANKPARFFWHDELPICKIPTETLIEGILEELGIWDETGGKHRDVINYTLYPASRYSDGLVPNSYLYGGEFFIDYTNPDYAHPFFRARSAGS